MDDNKPADKPEEQATPEVLEIPKKKRTSPYYNGTKAKHGRYRTRLTTKEMDTVIELVSKNVSTDVIANAINRETHVVTQILEKFKPLFLNLEKANDFKVIRENILNAGQLTVLKSALAQEKIDEAKFGELMKGFDILYKAERLETGKSTSNIITKSFVDVNLDDL